MNNQKEIESWLKETEKTAQRWTCEYQLSQSTVMQQNSGGHFAMSVTKATYPRAMKLLRLLIRRFQKEGWSLDVSGTGHMEPASAVIVDGERIPFKIREKHTRVVERSGMWTSNVLKADGRLAVEFYKNGFSHQCKEYADTPYTKAEDKIDDMVVWLRKASVSVREDRLERERWQEENRERERIRQEREAMVKRRVETVQSVMKDFRRYRKAVEIREFCEALRLASHGDEGCETKVRTALEVADWLDPTVDYTDNLLEGRISLDTLLNMLG